MKPRCKSHGGLAGRRHTAFAAPGNCACTTAPWPVTTVHRHAHDWHGHTSYPMPLVPLAPSTCLSPLSPPLPCAHVFLYPHPPRYLVLFLKFIASVVPTIQ